METKQAKTRDHKYDNLKASLIFLVVLGHYLTPISQTNFFAKMLYMVIYIFHMPAFVYVTGKFIKPNLKKAGYFLTLYIIFQILYTLFLQYIDDPTITWNIIEPQWVLWYLLTLTSYYLLAYIVPDSLTAIQKNNSLIIAFTIAIIIGFVPFIGPELSISRTLVFLPFFLMGKWENTNLNPEKTTNKKVIIYGMSAVVLSLVYMFGSAGNRTLLYHSADYTTTHSTWYFRLLVLITAVMFIKFLLAATANKRLPLMTYIGQSTLPIYLFHGFFVKIYHRFATDINILDALIMTVITIAIITGLRQIYQKIKSIIVTRGDIKNEK